MQQVVFLCYSISTGMFVKVNLFSKFVITENYWNG